MKWWWEGGRSYWYHHNDDDDIGEGGSLRWNDGGRVAGVKTREDFYCNTLPSTSLFYTLFMVFNLASSSSLFLFVAIQPFLHKYNYFHQWGLWLQNYLSISLLHVLSVPIWWHCWDDDIEKMVVMDCFICIFFLVFYVFFLCTPFLERSLREDVGV